MTILVGNESEGSVLQNGEEIRVTRNEIVVTGSSSARETAPANRTADAPSIVATSGSTIAASAPTEATTSSAQSAEAAAVCRLVLGRTAGSVDDMMDQFKGREDELIKALQTIRERVLVVNQKVSSGDEEANQTEIDMEKTAARAAPSHPWSIPEALYDPIKQLRMVDPVVNPAGDSYERSTLDGSVELNELSCYYYPNRALKSILQLQLEHERQQKPRKYQQDYAGLSNDVTGTTVDEEEKDIELGLPPILSSPLDPTKSHTASEIGVWHYDASNSRSKAPLPEAFYCPITCDIMIDPWIGPDGNTYEYDAISAWLEQNRDHPCSPVTRESLTLGQFRPNHAIYELIQYEIHGRGGPSSRPRHEAIQQWLDTTPGYTQRPSLSTTKLKAAPTIPTTTTSASGPGNCFKDLLIYLVALLIAPVVAVVLLLFSLIQFLFDCGVAAVVKFRSVVFGHSDDSQRGQE